MKVVYVEPADYIPEHLRKEYKLGEFAEENINVTVETKDGTIKAEGVAGVQNLTKELNKQQEGENVRCNNWRCCRLKV